MRKLLWEEMEDAFDSCVDDAFYEFNEAASAMLAAIASRLEQTIDSGGTVEDVVDWLRSEAIVALKHSLDKELEKPQS
jgi:hypothetical protein